MLEVQLGNIFKTEQTHQTQKGDQRDRSAEIIRQTQKQTKPTNVVVIGQLQVSEK